MAGIVTSSKVIHPGSSPDVDSDFNTKVRTPVYEHVQDRYGADKVSNIATQARFGSKKAFKSMCTIYSIPPAAANRLTKLIPPPIEGVECKIADIFNPESSRYDEGAEFRSATQEDQWQKIIEGAIAIEGRISGTGAHACGVLLSSQPISSVVPTKVRKDDGRLLSQWAYPECESLGLVKMDFLGLDTVDLVQDAVEYIKRAGKEPPNMVNLIHGPMDDEKTYEMLRAGDTIGIFQLAGAGVQDLLRKMQPDSIDDIAAATALYRPGPMGMLSHVRYAERKSGREELGVPIHEDFVGSPLEEILKPTQNLCVPAGTLIYDGALGHHVAIEDLREGESKTISVNPTSGVSEFKTVDRVVETGPKRIVRIGTAFNREILLSETHPILTRRGWVAAGELTTDDFIVYNSTDPNESPRNSVFSNDLAYFLGAMLGDGSFGGNNSPYLTNADADVIAEMKRIAESEFDDIVAIERPRYKSDGSYKLTVTTFSYRNNIGKKGRATSRNPIRDWFDSLGYGDRNLYHEKFIPSEVMESSKENLVSLLAGLWDTDGTHGSHGGHLVTTSEQLYNDIRLILDKLGIDYGVREDPYVNAKRPNRTAYRIYPDPLAFAERIAPAMRCVRKSGAKIVATRSGSSGREWATRAAIEALVDYYTGKVDTSGATDITRKNFASGNIGACGLMDILISNGVLEKSPKTALIDHAEKLDILPETVKMAFKNKNRKVQFVEYAGVEECYDIEVADNHNFLVSGAIVHNCVFQEQVIQIANRIAGMTLQEGDDLRKAMGKKKLDVMAKMKPKFFEGAQANGYSDEAVERLWDTIAEFGKYGFNRSHSYSYAIVAYQSAWLKANYPIEFMASLLATNVGDKDKILAFLKEARRMGITVGTADVNKSDVRVAPNLGDEGPDIVYGLSSISSVSESISEAIVKERNENGLYKSLTDFIDRTSAIGVARKNIFVALAHAGAFDSFGVTRKAVVEAVPHLMGDSKVKNKRGASLFDMFGSEEESLDYELGTEEYPFAEMVEHEAAVIGLYLTSHPLERVGKETSRLAETSIEKLLKSQEPRRRVKIAGAITDMESKIMQRGGKSITVTIDDGTGYLEARLTPDFVKAVDKGNAQVSVKKLYMDGANKIADYAAKSLRNNVDAVPAIVKNRVYKMTIDFYPGEDGALPRVRLSDATPVTLADDGTLPIRMRFDSGTNKNAEKLRRALPKKIAEKWPGDSAIFVSEFDSTDPNAQNDAPQVYMDALEVIEKADDNAKKTPREWPPPQSGDPKDYAISTSLVEFSDSVEYVDSGYRADKTKVVEMAIEKFLGAENYDFGALDESLFQ